jgi:F0F1-type ATP synthase assembly protein I
MAERNSETNRKSGLAYAAAFTLFMCVAALTGVGWAVDRWLGTRPAFLIGGIILGSIAGFYQFVRLTSKL